jgi:hypothetical protein
VILFTYLDNPDLDKKCGTLASRVQKLLELTQHIHITLYKRGKDLALDYLRQCRAAQWLQEFYKATLSNPSWRK